MLLLLAPALGGTHFSPSFTALFFTVFLVTVVLGEFAGQVPMVLGSLLVVPATYIYAAGDDWILLDLCLSLLLTVGFYGVLLRRWKADVLEHLLRLLLLEGALFALACGITSVALLPVGLGVALILAARYLEQGNIWLTAVGMVLCDVFLISPMLFPGGAT